MWEAPNPALVSVGTAAPASEDANEPGEGKEQLICKREVPIGSLIVSRKVCLTRSEWDARAIDGQSTANKLMMAGMGRGGTMDRICTGRDC
jgi:hypothetical protein